MISKQHRFHGHNSLNYVYKHGRSNRSSTITIKYSRNNKRSVYRAAVVVSKKVHKSAVVRNRIRRRIYEIIRKKVPANLPYDIVVTVYATSVADMPSEELSNVISSQLQQAGILE